MRQRHLLSGLAQDLQGLVLRSSHVRREGGQDASAGRMRGLWQWVCIRGLQEQAHAMKAPGVLASLLPCPALAIYVPRHSRRQQCTCCHAAEHEPGSALFRAGLRTGQRLVLVSCAVVCMAFEGFGRVALSTSGPTLHF